MIRHLNTFFLVLALGGGILYGSGNEKEGFQEFEKKKIDYENEVISKINGCLSKNEIDLFLVYLTPKILNHTIELIKTHPINSITFNNLKGDKNLITKLLMELAKELKVNRSIKSVALWGLNLNQEAMKYIFNALERNETVTKLDLGHIPIYTDEEVKALADMINNNDTITSLDLGGCLKQTNADSRKLLAEALLENKTINEFAIGHNDFEFKHIQPILDGLTNNELRSLDFSCNQLKDEGMKYLSESLNGSHIVSIRLLANEISDKGAVHLFSWLKGHNIVSVDLECNRLSSMSDVIVDDFVKGSRRLKKLVLLKNFPMLAASVKSAFDLIK